MRLSLCSFILLLNLISMSASAYTVECEDLSVAERQKLRLPASIEVPPGGTVRPVIQVFGRKMPPWMPATVLCKATWKVKPADGIELNRGTGEFRVASNVAHGQLYSLTAEIDGVKKPLVAQVRVFRRESNPFVGVWKEKGGQQIRVLDFKADGTFVVIHKPFEAYIDYRGTYVFDLKKKTLELKITGGNRVPRDLDPKGAFSLEKGNVLKLEGMYLGTWAPAPTGPGHVFVK